MKRIFSIVTAAILAAGIPAQAERAVTVFAAASLGGALEDIAQSYDRPVVFAYGGSGSTARQVAAGAPADLVVLANPVWIKWLEDQGVIAPNSTQIVAGNTLVLIAPKGTPPLADLAELPALIGDARLAIGHRDAVPAGTYARQWLEQADLWAAVEPHLAETDNVRTALALVARGDVPFGVVYASDAQAEPAVDVAYAIPVTSHDAVLYPAAALTDAGAAFLAHLGNPQSAAIFAAYGFQRKPQ